MNEVILMSILNMQSSLTTIEKASLSYRYLYPDLAPWLTLSGSDYSYLEKTFMVTKMFEPLKFDFRCEKDTFKKDICIIKRSCVYILAAILGKLKPYINPF